MRAQGLLLAAGAGSRMGMPKALVRFPDGTPWLTHAVRVLRDGGCADVTVVLGAAAAEAADHLDGLEAQVTVASDWAEGMSASLRAGLTTLDTAPDSVRAALVSLVDLPDLTAAVVRRVLTAGERSDALARASYDGRPGHPVLIGREHWAGVVAGASGDAGARDYLADHEAALVECGDLATGQDVDTLDRSASG